MGGELEYWQEDAERLNRMATLARSMGVVVSVLPPTQNAFCPTGEGGGVDPSCSPGGHTEEDAKAAFDKLAHDLHPALAAVIQTELATTTVRAQVKAAVVKSVASRMTGVTDEQLTAFSGSFARQEVKDRNADLKQRAADVLIDRWARSSADNDTLAQAVQERAREVFGVKDSYDNKKQLDILDGDNTLANTIGRHSAVIDSYLRATYEYTQEQLKHAGIEEFTLHRGMNIKGNVKEGLQDAQLQPLSSYSFSKGIARSFASDTSRGQTAVVLHSYVPRERVFSTFATGAGAMPESEVVVLGGKIKAHVEKLE